MWELFLYELHLSQLLCPSAITHFPIDQRRVGEQVTEPVRKKPWGRGEEQAMTGTNDSPLSNGNNDETHDSPISSSLRT